MSTTSQKVADFSPVPNTGEGVKKCIVRNSGFAFVGLGSPFQSQVRKWCGKVWTLISMNAGVLNLQAQNAVDCVRAEFPGGYLNSKYFEIYICGTKAQNPKKEPESSTPGWPTEIFRDAIAFELGLK